MPQRILVLHGPNLNLLDGDRSLEAIDARLQARAVALGVQVKCFQSNWEGALLDQLAHERNWFDAVIINPASLAPSAVGIAEALKLLKRPAVEVLLDDAKRGRSALKEVTQRQVYGKGPSGYLEALDSLAPKGAVERAKAPGKQAISAAMATAPRPLKAVPSVAPARSPSVAPERSPSVAPERSPSVHPERSRGTERAVAEVRGTKTIGRQPTAAAPAEVRGSKTIGPGAQPRMPQNRPQGQKTIGPGREDNVNDETIPFGKSLGPRKVAQGAAVERGKSLGRRTTSGELHVGLTRDDVRKKIAERLSGRTSPSGLATWARGQWQELQRGAPCETGQRDMLEDVLQTLLLSSASKASDEQLIDLMTQLG